MGGRDDLVTGEGVDEGSADAEPGTTGDVVGEPPHGAPASEQDAAPPQDLGGAAATAPGQQLEAGEG